MKKRKRCSICKRKDMNIYKNGRRYICYGCISDEINRLRDILTKQEEVE